VLRLASSLRARLLALVLLALLPALGLVLRTGLEQRDAAAEDVKGDALQFAHLVALNQLSSIEATRQLLVGLGEVPALRKLDLSSCNEVLAHLNRQYPNYTILSAVSPAGDAVCNSVPLSGPVNVADRAYFQRALASRDFVVGDYVVGRITGKPAVNVAWPVLDEAGQIQVLLVAGLDLVGLSQLTSEAQLPPGSTVTVFDRAGKVLIRGPDPAQWLGVDASETPLYRSIRQADEEGAVEQVGLDQVMRLYAFTPLEKSDTAPATVVAIGIPLAIAHEPAERTLWINLVELGVVAILALLAAWLGGEAFLLRRLAALVGATRRLQAGDLASRAGSAHGSGEIGELARAFDEMAQSLERRESERERAEQQIQALNAELEQHVAERTAQLTAAIDDLHAEIVERKRAETALRESEGRFRTIFERAGVGMSQVDASGRIIEINRALEQMLGYSSAELTGKRFAELTVAEDGAIRLASFEKLANGERDHYQMEKRYQRKDGSLVWGQATVSAIRAADGRLNFALGIVEDISTRREAERQLQALAQTEKLRALGQMASGIAHDLNQSLALVTGHGDLALRALDATPKAPPTLRSSVSIMVSAAADGAESVARLLTFARASGGGEAEAVNLALLLEEVAQLTAPRWRDASQAEGRPIRLEVQVEGQPVIRGWAAGLREAYTNLVFNAVDALPLGGTIQLRARCRGQWVETEVVDTGIGMSAETQARVFEPFFSTKGERGSGLGLAMVFGIVERNQGRISIESAPGRGTTFFLQFPAAPALAQAQARPAESAAARRLRVLVVDDEVALREMAAAMLHSLGHIVSLAGSGEAALELLATQPFDLVISDLGMGQGMNGWDLARQVRERFGSLQFVLATGWGAEITPEQAQASGVDAVLAKPFRLAALSRLLASL
jgi:PAS domain S-box-containing protein